MKKSRLTIAANNSVQLYKCHTVIVGSGAAGLNCAERLHNAGVKDVVILTTHLFGGTSYCSGSDKQTYYKMSVFGEVADSPIAMAHSLFDGGCMDGDLAYIEGLYSLPAFFHLVENGVPFPCNTYGAYVGYKTDHDPRQRATSAGPKTSRYMVETSLKKVQEKGIQILDKMTVVKVIAAGDTEKKACGVVAINAVETGNENLGITVFWAENVVLATGGPGELYANSVYPQGQVSLHGVALEAGANAVNLSECQFGIASTAFRWNLSGTYQQVIPSYFSVGEDGVRRNFLPDFYRSLPEMASNIFLKGYQWPFSAGRVPEYGSSLVDIAVAREIQAGKRVYLDFMNNPSMDGETFSIETLNPEVQEYLHRSGATQPTPYERLVHMNPQSIELYEEHGIDLHEPLEISVSFQHCNGGLRINNTYETDIAHLFAIGEIAGAHGVTRPGGTALNSGQVGGIRVAQHLSKQQSNGWNKAFIPILRGAAEDVMQQGRTMLNTSDNNHVAVREDLQQRMTSSCAFLRNPETIDAALSTAGQSAAQLPGAKSPEELAYAWETKNLQTTQRAFIASIQHYIQNGGGSRGSYLVLDTTTGTVPVSTKNGTLLSYRKERLEDRQSRVRVSGPDMSTTTENTKPLPDDTSWFETTWADWLKEKAERPENR